MQNKGIGLEMRSLNNQIRRYFEFSSHKREIERVTGNNGWIIGYLAERSDKDVYQRDIEKHFNITRSTVSKVMSLMEQKGLISRQAVAADARLKKIVLTKKAWELRGIMTEDVSGLEEALLTGFSTEEIETLRSYLVRMRENISKAREKNGECQND